MDKGIKATVEEHVETGKRKKRGKVRNRFLIRRRIVVKGRARATSSSNAGGIRRRN